MAKKTSPKSVPFPTKEEILGFIQDSSGRVGKREIARAFHIRGDAKIPLKALLKEMEAEGLIGHGRKRRYGGGGLPPVTMLEVTGTDLDGEVLARPLTWPQTQEEEDGMPPVIYMMPERAGQPALGAGDRVLARLKRITGESVYEGRTIRRISSAPSQVLGIFARQGGAGRLKPTNKRAKGDYLVPRGDEGGAREGELVWAQVLPGRRLGLRQARITERLGETGSPGSFSMIAIHDRDIPYTFTDEAVEQARRADAAPLDGREDLRAIPLITIDGADARDFDDAVWAEADMDKKNSGGWHLMVAIADVSWYVRPGDALDRSAYERGNSVYFPDRVVPMLPEGLSNGWCSLKPQEDRPCLAVHLWIDAGGSLVRHKFVRGLMRSTARLTYTQAQEAQGGAPDDTTRALVESVIAPLYGAFASLDKARHKRGVLELDLPERRIVLADNGTVERVDLRQRLDSHRLVEEFMITANVAAARELERLRQPCMYRIHDQPSPDKIDALAQFLESIGIRFAKGQVVKPARFNQILTRAKKTPHARMVSDVVLRSQAQAEYAPENIGHFGLALTRYCHFTSPIRRYSDLLVHRALILGLKLGAGGLEKDHRDFVTMGEHLSVTERRAAGAERDAVDRFTAAFLADRVGATFKGRISGVTRFGLFVTLDDTGADGLVPMKTLADDYYVHDEARHLLRGRKGRREYRLGDEVEVILAEADPITGGMIMHLLDSPETGAEKGRNGRKPTRRHGTRGRR